ncbi:MAG: hypothetical protein AB1941_28570 [Gemmatimonadota bacterium]
MLRSNTILAQALTEYAGMQVHEVLSRVEGSVRTLEPHELAAAGVVAVLLLRR